MAPLLERGNAPSTLAGCSCSLTLGLIMDDHLMCNSTRKKAVAAPAFRDRVWGCERGAEAGEEIVCSLQSFHAAPHPYPVCSGFSLFLCRSVCLPMCTGASAQHIVVPPPSAVACVSAQFCIFAFLYFTVSQLRFSRSPIDRRLVVVKGDTVIMAALVMPPTTFIHLLALAPPHHRGCSMG